MSAPDPASSVAPPKVDEPPYAPRRGLSPAFWIVMAFGLLCVIAGYAVAAWGPRLLPAAPRPPPPLAAAPATAALPGARRDKFAGIPPRR